MPRRLTDDELLARLNGDPPALSDEELLARLNGTPSPSPAFLGSEAPISLDMGDVSIPRSPKPVASSSIPTASTPALTTATLLQKPTANYPSPVDAATRALLSLTGTEAQKAVVLKQRGYVPGKLPTGETGVNVKGQILHPEGKGFNLGDITTGRVGDILPTAAILGTAPTGAGLLATALSGGAALAAGQAGNEGLLRLLMGPDVLRQESSGQLASRIAGNVAGGTAAGLVGEGLRRAIAPSVELLSRGNPIKQEAINVAQQEGVTLHPAFLATKEENPLYTAILAKVKGAPLGARPLTRAQQEVNALLERKVTGLTSQMTTPVPTAQNVLEKILPGSSPLAGATFEDVLRSTTPTMPTAPEEPVNLLKSLMPGTVNVPEVGAAAQEGRKTFASTFETTRRTIYQKISNAIGKEPAVTPASQDLTQQALEVYGTQNHPLLKKFAERIAPPGEPIDIPILSYGENTYPTDSNYLAYRQKIREMLGDPLYGTLKSENPQPLSYDELKQWHTRIGNAINWNDPRPGDTDRYLRGLYGTIGKDLLKTAEARGTPEIVAQAQAADQYMTENLKLLTSPLGKKLKFGDPSEIMSLALRSPENITRLQQMAPEQIPALQDQFLRNLLTKSTGPDDFLTKWQALKGTGHVSALFDADRQQTIESTAQQMIQQQQQYQQQLAQHQLNLKQYTDQMRFLTKIIRASDNPMSLSRQDLTQFKMQLPNQIPQLQQRVISQLLEKTSDPITQRFDLNSFNASWQKLKQSGHLDLLYTPNQQQAALDVLNQGLRINDRNQFVEKILQGSRDPNAPQRVDAGKLLTAMNTLAQNRGAQEMQVPGATMPLKRYDLQQAFQTIASPDELRQFGQVRSLAEAIDALDKFTQRPMMPLSLRTMIIRGIGMLLGYPVGYPSATRGITRGLQGPVGRLVGRQLATQPIQNDMLQP